MKRGPAWGVVACYVETQGQNLNWIPVQTTGAVLLALNFMNRLVLSFKHDLYQKSHISGHLLRWPLWDVTGELVWSFKHTLNTLSVGNWMKWGKCVLLGVTARLHCNVSRVLSSDSWACLKSSSWKCSYLPEHLASCSKQLHAFYNMSVLSNARACACALTTAARPAHALLII
jgi:hypothetical protein